MTKTFTQDDVIRYIYKETSRSENVAMEEALLCNASLQEVYNKYTSIVSDLEKVVKKPSDRVINSILNYSKSLNLHST